MAQISLYDLFPEADDGSRGPLPKQKLFMSKALTSASPKYIRYVGGIGSGKSLIGCITVLAWAIQYPGDYLIARQFYPELKDTTYRTFLELCPEELILEHRVADKIVKIKSAGGGIATILFRPLEEPDKMRSLNLNGFYVDEANQVSEAAFVLLQGRLRGKHVRKGILTQNSGGHDWSWRWFVKKDMMTKDSIKQEFFNIVAPSTENVHLPDGYVETMMDTWSEDRIAREILADEDSFEGQIYPEFREDTHVIRPFAIPESWTRVVGVDHGYRNPAAWIWGAVDEDENIYIYREFYETEWDIEEICKGKKDPRTGGRIPGEKGVIALNRKEKLSDIRIDPSTKAKRGGKEEAHFDQYIEHLPDNWPLNLANNSVHTGIDRVKQYLKVSKKTNKPRIFVFSTCTNLINELQTYRFEEIPLGQQGMKNEKEDPRKYNDHACDALRYLIMGRPEPEENENSWYESNKIDYHSLEGRLHRDIQNIKKPKKSQRDPFGDY